MACVFTAVCSKPCPGYCVAPDECQCKDDAGKSAPCGAGRGDYGGAGTQLRQSMEILHYTFTPISYLNKYYFSIHC